MSKLGVHVSAGPRTGFGDFLKKCAGAGSPVPVIFSVDQDVWPDVQKFSPQTVVIFRNQPRTKQGEGLDAPLGTYKTDPLQSARDWMGMVMPSWAKNKAHYYAPINEQDPGLSGYKWLNDFTLECMKIAEANGYKLALYAFSAGNPRDPKGPDDIDQSTLEQKWHELIPSLQMAKASGHILLLHEYGFGAPMLKTSAPNLALRYRRSLRYLHQFNADPELVISEAGAGAGGMTGGLNAWLEDVKWYDSELMKDRGVIGCCLYQVGGAENIMLGLSKLGDYIAQTKTPSLQDQADPVVAEPAITPVPPIPPITTEPPGSTGTPGSTTPPSTAPVSTGPLDFNVRLVNCRRDPSRPNGVILTFQIDATGGSGEYTYTREGQVLPGATFDRLATRSGNVVDAYRVSSSDGQMKERKFFFAARDFNCP